MTTLSVISSSRLAGGEPGIARIVAATSATRSDWANWRADRLTLMTSGCADG